MADLKSARLNLRLAEDDDRLFREAASAASETVSEFLVESARERARRLLADRTEFTLDEARWEAFTSALDRPAEVRPELAELFSRPKPK